MKKVFCVGTFDILHKGHIEFFKDIKQGGYLIVIVVPDRAVRENKSRNPINSQKIRVKNLKKIKLINEVIPTDSVRTTLRMLSGDKARYFCLRI